MISDVKVKISTQASCVDDEGTVWIFSNDCNALFSWEDGKITYIASFDDEGVFEGELYNKALNKGDDIFFFPVRAKRIACYSKTAKQAVYIEIPERKENTYFNIIRKNENQVWMFPVFRENYAYMFDLRQKTIQKFEIPWNELNLQEGACLLGDALLLGYAYLAVSRTNFLLKFNIESDEYEKIEVERPVFQTHAFEDSLYMLSASGCAVLKMEDGRLKTVLKQDGTNAENEVREKKDMDYIDFFPVSSGGMLLLPMEGGRQPYHDILADHETIYLMPYEGNEMTILDSGTLGKTVVKLEISRKEYQEIIVKAMTGRKNILLNEELVSLESFISLVKNS